MADLDKIRQLGKDERIPYDLLLIADETVEAIDKYIFECEIYVVERGNRVVALYALQVLNVEEAEIKNIAVAAEYQKQGIGTQLLKDAVDRARRLGFKRVIIGTWDNSGMPIRFYLKEGFVKYAVKKDFFTLNYQQPIFDQGVQLRDMVMLKKELN